jgi:hypothetical protein
MIKIPKGWVKLRNGALLKPGDKFWCCGVFDYSMSAEVKGSTAGEYNNGDCPINRGLGLVGKPAIYIRRISKRKAK